jgi:hypothetical protein
MALVDMLLNAMNDPNQQGSSNELSSLANAAQTMGSNYGLDPATTQTVLSLVGTHVRSALQQQRDTGGAEQAQSLVNNYSGFSPNAQAVQALFPPQWQAEIIQQVSQRTGLDSGMIQAMLPLLIPVILNLLKMGSNSQNPQQAQNPVLNNFLDTDGDGDVDIADAFGLAGRYLSKGQ